MTRFKAFVVTFVLTFSIMLICFMGLYWYVQYSSPKAAGEVQQGVPVLSLTPDDTKTTLVALDCGKARFYFLLQLNAIQSRVNIAAVPPSFYLSQPDRTLDESMAYAGIRQCVQDLSEQFDISIDHYLVCDEVTMGSLLESFDTLDTQDIAVPQSVKQYLLKGSRYVDADTLLTAVGISADLLDNSVGIEFLTAAGQALLQDNLQKLADDVPQAIKDSYTQLNTDIGIQQMEQLRRIVRLLGGVQVRYGQLVLTDSDTAQQQIDLLFKE